MERRTKITQVPVGLVVLLGVARIVAILTGRLSTKPAPTALPAVKAGSPATPVVAATCGLPSNRFGYNLCGSGSKILAPVTQTCATLPCVPNFDAGNGFLVQCVDGKFSMTGGTHEPCSSHEGVKAVVTKT